MFSHMTVGSNDLTKAKTFYDAVFTAIGAKPSVTDPRGRLFYRHNGSSFVITEPIDGAPASHGNGSTIGFTMDSPEQAAAWHAAGIAAGGTSIEDPPGWRDGNTGRIYLAYLRDPDGNKLCAMHRG